jgi:hypothetical protein
MSPIHHHLHIRRQSSDDPWFRSRGVCAKCYARGRHIDAPELEGTAAAREPCREGVAMIYK